MTIKVLQVYKTFFPETKGGVENTIHCLSKDLKKHNIECKVLCLTKDKNKSITKFDEIEVVRYPQTTNFASCPTSLSLLTNFRKEAEWADVIHFHYPWPFGDLLSVLAPKKKKLVTYHSDIVKQKVIKFFYKPLEQYFLHKADRIIATSPHYVLTSTNLKRFNKKVSAVPIGLNAEYYPNADAKNLAEIKKKYGENFILFIGQLRYYKGLHLLLEAMKDIPTNLVIIGTGKEEKRLKEIRKNLSLENVHFLGQLSEQDKVNYLSACYSLVLPSHLRSEAYGLSLIEGAMFSKPLLSCKIGSGTDYINLDSQTGVVVAPTAESIKNGISLLLSEKKKAASMGRNARKRFEKTFTSDIMSKKIAKIIKDLV